MLEDVFLPYGDNVIVEVAERPEQTKSGLYIPESAQEGQVVEGTIVSVGNGRMTDDGNIIPCRLKDGMHVWFPKFNGTKITVDGTEYYVISERQLLAYR